MSRLPRELRACLTTRIDVYEIETDPAARRVTVRAPGMKPLRLRVDFANGFTEPAILGGVDRTRDIIAAIAPTLAHARRVTMRYELAAHAVIRFGMDHAFDLDLAATQTSESTKACADAIPALDRWCRFHADVAEREDGERKMAAIYGYSEDDARRP